MLEKGVCFYRVCRYSYLLFFLKNITEIPTEGQTVLEADHVQPFVGPDLGKNCFHM